MLSENVVPSPKGKGILFVISAPAGTGKTTLVHMLCRQFPQISVSVSCTTRSPRENEIDGVHYHFLGKEEFENSVKQGRFLEFVELYGHYYGTSLDFVEEMLNSGRHVILVIDTQGAIKLKKCMAAVFIFIVPPSLEVLKERLVKRGSETEEDMQQRLDWAKHELSFVKEYEYSVINDHIDSAYEVLKSIIIAECHKTRRW